MKKIFVLFVMSVSFSLSIIAQNATTWNGHTLDASNVYDNGFDFLLGRTNGSAQARFITSPGIKNWLGIPSGGETLQSVTDRGYSTSNSIETSSQTGFVLSYGGLWNIYTDGGNFRIAETNVAPRFAILKNSGNVGIGTPSPSSKLDVNGDIRLSSMLTFSSGTLYSDANNMASFHDGGFVWSSADNSITKMLLSGNGDLFVSGNQTIGRTWAKKNLDVNGDIKTRKIKVTQTDWSDYVFDSSYELVPLHQVEKYIQVNKHLPDVPSADEVKKEGLDLGENQAVLLKKIEELTLYIIEQNKQLNVLSRRVQQLEGNK